MKIGIDARIYGDTGIGRYVSNLISEMEKIDTENDYVIFLTKEGNELYHPNNPKFKKWIVDVTLYSLREQTVFLKELLRARLDLLHVPHFNIPVFYPRKIVVTIHDLTMHGSGLKGSSTLPSYMFMLKKLGYYITSNASTYKAEEIMVPTEAVKKEVSQKLLGAKKEKIKVTYEGVDADLLSLAPSDDKVLRTRLEEMRVTNPYFLYVGSSYEHKNLRTLIVSYKEWILKSDRKVQLVIAGKVDRFAEQLAAFVHGLQLDSLVIFAAKYTDNFYVPEKDLAYLYKGALAYVFPSFNEGFSITPLEAQAFGIPVLLSNIPTHKEVFGESVLYFDPESTMELSEKLTIIATDQDLRQKLIEAGKTNISKYSWHNMASETYETYRRILG